jgi:hypothetical protein
VIEDVSYQSTYRQDNTNSNDEEMKDDINDRGTKIPKRNNPWDNTSNYKKEEALEYQ